MDAEYCQKCGMLHDPDDGPCMVCQILAENESLRQSGKHLYAALYNCLSKFPCDHKYSTECTACAADQVLNREDYLRVNNKYVNLDQGTND